MNSKYKQEIYIIKGEKLVMIEWVVLNLAKTLRGCGDLINLWVVIG